MTKPRIARPNAFSSIVESAALFSLRKSQWLARLKSWCSKCQPLETLRRAPAEGLRPARAEVDSFDFYLLQTLEIPQNRQRNLWKSLERNSLDLERLGKKLGAVVIHYRKLYFSLNSPTCAGVSGRIGSERSIRNSLAVSSSSSVAYRALASEAPATTLCGRRRSIVVSARSAARTSCRRGWRCAATNRASRRGSVRKIKSDRQ